MDRSNKLERKLELVVQTGMLLSRSFDLDSIVQSAVDAGLHLCGAQFAAFLYNATNEAGETLLLHKLSGIDQKTITGSAASLGNLSFSSCFQDGHSVRSRDVTLDPKYPLNSESWWIPTEFPPIRSYLAVPVTNPAGVMLGGLFYGHEDVDIFEQSSEDLVATVAAQVTVAIENVRLRDQLTTNVRDLQKIRLAQQDASKRLGQLAAIVSSSDDAIISKDLNGIVTSWNQAAVRILGYSEKEMIGASILKLIPEDLHADEGVILGKIRVGERIDHFETVRLSKSGELIDVSLTVSPIRDATGIITGASKILRDISDAKRMERSLLQAEKIAAAGRMAATIAHEINNPLEAVVNLLYLLRPSVNDEEGLGYLNSAEDELNRVSHIARQTLGFYREHASASRTSLVDLIGHTIAVYQPRCSSCGIQLEYSLHGSTDLVLRRGEIMQVVSNLIANAIYAMPSGGTLRVALREADGPEEGAIFSISDNGVGISPENLPRVFDAFFTTRNSIGTGIGLFVAKQFIEGHGGGIKIESSQDPDRHGTTVSVFLPLHTLYEETGISNTVLVDPLLTSA